MQCAVLKRYLAPVGHIVLGKKWIWVIWLATASINTYGTIDDHQYEILDCVLRIEETQVESYIVNKNIC